MVLSGCFFLVLAPEPTSQDLKPDAYLSCIERYRFLEYLCFGGILSYLKLADVVRLATNLREIEWCILGDESFEKMILNAGDSEDEDLEPVPHVISKFESSRLTLLRILKEFEGIPYGLEDILPMISASLEELLIGPVVQKRPKRAPRGFLLSRMKTVHLDVDWMDGQVAASSLATLSSNLEKLILIDFSQMLDEDYAWKKRDRLSAAGESWSSLP
ncbi:hypothetical protein K474DRAFT_1670933 [Panus rudis PR-1116 ss-1]|nr:hypothetical protein K474DRAFT_1670933 [Panus rudis PR-1116 ss-1]